MAWDTGALQAEIDRAVDEFTALVAGKSVTVDGELVTAVMRLDGALRRLVVDPRAMRRHGAGGLAELITETIRLAEHEAARCRDVLAAKVTFLGHPVLELVQEMIDNPEGVGRRLAAGAELGR